MEMVCILKTVLIFCFIQLIKAVELKIDGLIDLGPKWSFAYRILRPSNEDLIRRNIGSHEKHSSGAGFTRFDTEYRFHRDKKKLHRAEKRLREEAKRLRNAKVQIQKQAQVEATAQTGKHHQARTTPHKHLLRTPEETHMKVKTSKPTEHEQHSEHKLFDASIELSTPESKLEPERDSEPALIRLNESKGKKKKNHTLHKLTTWSPRDSEDDTKILERENTKNKFTVLDMYDFTTARKPKTIRTTKSTTASPKAVVASVVKDSNKTENNTSMRELLRLAYEKIGEISNTTTTSVITTVPTTTKRTTTQVTTVRTADIFTNPHKVKDDAKIKEFNDHIYKHSLKVFNTMKTKTNLYRLRKQVDMLARTYEDKFKEFLRDTSNLKIRTRLGTQKVILNTIDTSNHMLKRLINFMMGDMNNMPTANVFRNEIEKEHKAELNHICKNIGICRTQNSFSVFLTEVIAIILGSNNKMFKQYIDAFTESVKYANFDNVFESHIKRKIIHLVQRVEMLPVELLRPSLTIIKNIMYFKNIPIIVNTASAVVSSRVNSTLAFLEIVDLLDQNTPPNEANTLEWNDIKTSLKDSSEGKRDDVQDIIEVFVKHVFKNIEALDETSKEIVSKNMDIILG